MSTPPLGYFEDRVWQPDPGAHGGRRARSGGRYHVFVPARIAERRFSFDDNAVSALADAAKALAELDGDGAGPDSLRGLTGSLLLRSESAASSRIEGLRISQRRLARVAFLGKTGSDRTAAEILGNVEAMKRAIDLGAARSPFEVADLTEIHRLLLRFSPDRAIAGQIRERQSWIGGNEFNPLEAAYVPPPPEQVPALLDDLCRFICRNDLAPVAQAAIAHAQFENIHPFADGNGRVGRALIHTVLRRGGEAVGFVPPVSLVLAAEPRNYVAGFGAFSSGDVSAWCATFAEALERASLAARELETEIDRRREEWLDRLGRPRRDAAVRRIVAVLPQQPVIDVAAGREVTGKSHVAVQTALKQLEQAQILLPLGERKWGRAWECRELLDLVEGLERRVASP